MKNISAKNSFLSGLFCVPHYSLELEDRVLSKTKRISNAHGASTSTQTTVLKIIGEVQSDEGDDVVKSIYGPFNRDTISGQGTIIWRRNSIIYQIYEGEIEHNKRKGLGAMFTVRGRNTYLDFIAIFNNDRVMLQL